MGSLRSPENRGKFKSGSSTNKNKESCPGCRSSSEEEALYELRDHQSKLTVR